MIRLSIRRKIMGIAVALIVLMTITAILSMVWVIAGRRSPARADATATFRLMATSRARISAPSSGRLALRRMVIEKMQSPSSGDKFAAIRNVFDAKGAEVEREAQAARALINGLIEKERRSATTTALARLESRIDSAMAIRAASSMPRSSACCRARYR